MKDLISNQICRIIRTCGLPKGQTYQIVNEIDKWYNKSGAEWTVRRLKAIKQIYLHRLAGTSYEAPWISVHRDGTPKGPLSLIFKCKKPHKVLSMLTVYNAFKARTVTEGQWSKFGNSVSQDDVTRTTATGGDFLKMLSQHFQDQWIENPSGSPIYFSPHLDAFWHPVKISTRHDMAYGQLEPFEAYFGKIPKGEFITMDKLYDRKIRIPDISTDCSRSIPMDGAAIAVGVNHPYAAWYINNYGETLPDHILNMGMAIKPGCEEYGDVSLKHVGRIGFIQEPGYKLRAVANPLPIFQILLSRLGKNLYEVLRTRYAENDCTFDQNRGVNDTINFLNEGNEVMTLDLSDATNNFPLMLTLQWLSELGDDIAFKGDLELFALVSRGDWALPPNPAKLPSIRWNVGQPLGLYPSFAAFAISHHRLVELAEPKFYRILGDDIVIDVDAGKRLKSLYKCIGVPLSEDKCFTSDRMCEFAGKVLYKTNHVEPILQPKWRELSDRNFVILRRNLGRGVNRYLRSRQLKVVKVLEHLLTEHNSDFGLKDIRSLKTASEYQLSSDIAMALSQEDLETRSSPASRALKELKTHILIESVRTVHGMFEQIVPETTLKCGNSEETLLERVGVNTADFPENKAPSSWAQTHTDGGGDPRGATTLDVLERKIEINEISSKIDGLVDRDKQVKAQLAELLEMDLPTRKPIEGTSVPHKYDKDDEISRPDDDQQEEESSYRRP